MRGSLNLLRMAVIVAAAWYLLVYFVLAAVRVRYPFDLEWLEGAGLEHVRRIVAGQPLYTKPSLEFIAFPYTPLYYYVCAAVARVTGHLDFIAMRSVSVAASVGVFVLI